MVVLCVDYGTDKKSEGIAMIQIFDEMKYPLIQSPMAGVQGSELAIAVCEAGGLGSLPCAMLSVEALRQELATITAATDKPLNVNFFAHVSPENDERKEQGWRATLSAYYQDLGMDVEDIPAGAGRAPFNHEMANVLDEFKPAVVSFHFGLPRPELLARVKSFGAFVLSSATTVEEAVWLQNNGADGVIAQGLEAGGHRGHFLSHDLTVQMGVFSLLPQIEAAVDIPVIAAGGIADADGVKMLMEMGASAVQVGTSFLLCNETKTTKLHRDALKGEGAQHTALTNVFSGRPARGIVNKIIRELGPISDKAPTFPLAGGAIGPLKAAAEKQGISDYSSLWSGQNNSGCQEIPAEEMVKLLCAKL